jgi:hypothetical protein
MKGTRIAGVLISSILLSAAFAGCGGGSKEKASVPTNNQVQPPSVEKAVKESPESPNKTSMNIVDMEKQIVITEETKQQDAKSPDPVPNDIPVLDNARKTTALKIGDGSNPGDPYYQISFQMDESVKKAGDLYRQVLKDKGINITAELEEGGMQMFKINTNSWEVTINIFTFLEHTTVWINYTKK